MNKEARFMVYFFIVVSVVLFVGLIFTFVAASGENESQESIGAVIYEREKQDSSFDVSLDI